MKSVFRFWDNIFIEFALLISLLTAGIMVAMQYGINDVYSVLAIVAIFAIASLFMIRTCAYIVYQH